MELEHVSIRSHPRLAGGNRQMSNEPDNGPQLTPAHQSFSPHTCAFISNKAHIRPAQWDYGLNPAGEIIPCGVRTTSQECISDVTLMWH